jgi:hypothetical protein
MRKPWIAVQLPAGREGASISECDAVERLLFRCRELAHADAVILQPAADSGHTSRLVSAARRAGLEVLLWFPVLADSPGAVSPPASLTRNADGSSGHGRSGAWEGLAGGEETFLFGCPNDTRNLSSARAALQSLLDTFEVDGVMLDKIRFPAPSNGLESLFCCFCESCRASFEAATGRPMGEVLRKCGAFLASLRSRGAAAFDPDWTDPGSFWKAAGVQELADFRADSITAVVRNLAGLARARSLGVGLDLFSPALAALVGQDYPALSALCDWVKPMTYRAAVGPAGLPLEIACLWKALRELGPRGDGPSARALLDRVFPWGLPAAESGLLKNGLPAEVIASELASLRRMPLAPSAGVLVGIEAVQIPAFGIQVTPRELEASLEAAAGLADGIIVSWDLRHVPEENLRLIGEAAR